MQVISITHLKHVKTCIKIFGTNQCNVWIMNLEAGQLRFKSSDIFTLALLSELKLKPLVHEALGGYSYTVQLSLLNINVLCRRTSVYNRSTTEVQVPSASCTRGLSVKPLVHKALGRYSYTVQLFLLNINALCRRTSMYNRSTTTEQSLEPALTGHAGQRKMTGASSFFLPKGEKKIRNMKYTGLKWLQWAC